MAQLIHSGTLRLQSPLLSLRRHPRSSHELPSAWHKHLSREGETEGLHQAPGVTALEARDAAGDLTLGGYLVPSRALRSQPLELLEALFMLLKLFDFHLGADGRQDRAIGAIDLIADCGDTTVDLA